MKKIIPSLIAQLFLTDRQTGEGVTVETWISPAFVDLTCICGFTSLIKATLPIRKLPQSEGESFDSAFLDSTLKKLLNLATKDYNLIP